MSRAELLDALARVGARRQNALSDQREANREARRLIPLARDAGATVEEAAGALKMSRAGVYSIMEG